MIRNIEARDSVLGYLYQIEFALVLLMKADRGAKLSLEKIDDIHLETEGDPVEILQLKHGVRGTPANLSNKSSQLWKTIGNWSQLFRSQKLPTSLILSLVTTAKAADDSVAAKLRPDSSRDNDAIVAELTAISNDSTNKELKVYFADFLGLSLSERKELVSRIQLLDLAPNIWKTEETIKELLRKQEYPEDVDAIYTGLTRWWSRRVLRHFANNTDAIAKEEYLSELKGIREFFTTQNLPLNFEEAVPPKEWFENQNRYRFVQQLTLISMERPDIEQAIRDYYRAFQERTRWLDEKRVDFEELERYETRLIEHWGLFIRALKRRLKDYSNSESDKIQFGQQVYDEILQKNDLPPLRPKITADYVRRGNYHVLANYEPKPRVWWHPDFLERLKDVLPMPTEETFISAPESGLPPWRMRSVEVANMLNPAFCAVVLYDTIKGYQEQKHSGMPFTLIRLIFPVILHSPTRKLLPSTVRTKLHTWLQDNSEIKADFQIGYEEFNDISSEALIFALDKKMINKVDGTDIFTALPNLRLANKAKKHAGIMSSDVDEIRKVSNRLGRMFAIAGDVPSMYIWFGVRP